MRVRNRTQRSGPDSPRSPESCDNFSKRRYRSCPTTVGRAGGRPIRDWLERCGRVSLRRTLRVGADLAGARLNPLVKRPWTCSGIHRSGSSYTGRIGTRPSRQRGLGDSRGEWVGCRPDRVTPRCIGILGQPRARDLGSVVDDQSSHQGFRDVGRRERPGGNRHGTRRRPPCAVRGAQGGGNCRRIDAALSSEADPIATQWP